MFKGSKLYRRVFMMAIAHLGNSYHKEFIDIVRHERVRDCACIISVSATPPYMNFHVSVVLFIGLSNYASGQ